MIIKQNSLEFRGQFEARKATDSLVFHHAQAVKCSLEDIHRWHREKGWAGIGYHWLIRKDGSVYEGRPIWAIGAHALAHNDDSLGCCFEGDFNIEHMTDAQVKSGIELARDVRKYYPHIKLDKHSNINATACPGKHFNDAIIIEGAKDAPSMTINDGFNGIIDVLASYTDANGKPLVTAEYWKTNAVPGGIVKGEYARELIKKLFDKITI